MAENGSAVDGEENLNNNRDFCECCREGGDLLCCDNCPASFHLECIEPPLLRIPPGSWYCRTCAAKKAQISRSLCPLGPLIKKVEESNTSLFDIPPSFVRNFEMDYLQKQIPLLSDVCTICNELGSKLVKCNICKTCYHMHCLEPPLLKIPDYFECPKHSRHPVALNDSRRKQSNRRYLPSESISLHFNMPNYGSRLEDLINNPFFWPGGKGSEIQGIFSKHNDNDNEEESISPQKLGASCSCFDRKLDFYSNNNNNNNNININNKFNDDNSGSNAKNNINIDDGADDDSSLGPYLEALVDIANKRYSECFKAKMFQMALPHNNDVLRQQLLDLQRINSELNNFCLFSAKDIEKVIGVNPITLEVTRLTPLFVQFLAWQRVMQLYQEIPETFSRVLEKRMIQQSDHLPNEHFVNFVSDEKENQESNQMTPLKAWRANLLKRNPETSSTTTTSTTSAAAAATTTTSSSSSCVTVNVGGDLNHASKKRRRNGSKGIANKEKNTGGGKRKKTTKTKPNFSTVDNFSFAHRCLSERRKNYSEIIESRFFYDSSVKDQSPPSPPRLPSSSSEMKTIRKKIVDNLETSRLTPEEAETIFLNVSRKEIVHYFLENGIASLQDKKSGFAYLISKSLTRIGRGSKKISNNDHNNDNIDFQLRDVIKKRESLFRNDDTSVQKVSHHHVSIVCSRQSNGLCFILKCLGRNGIRINNLPVKSNEYSLLKNNDEIEFTPGLKLCFSII